MNSVTCIESSLVSTLKELQHAHCVSAARFSAVARQVASMELGAYLLDLANRRTRAADELRHHLEIRCDADTTDDPIDGNRWLLALEVSLHAKDDPTRLFELEQHERALDQQYVSAMALAAGSPVLTILRRQHADVLRTLASLQSLRDAHDMAG